MGRLSSTGTRRLLRVLALSVVAISGFATWALATGPGGWDHLGDGGTTGPHSLNFAASALKSTPGGLYVGGGFTGAGGIPNADRIARWNGTGWSAVGTSTEKIPDNSVAAIAVSGTRVFAGGNFHNAGGDATADNLAVWDGTTWEPFCDNPVAGEPAIDNSVTSLQIIGQTLYVGGEFQNGADIPEADYLLACDLASGDATPTVIDESHAFSGSVYALTADSNGTLYAGGLFTLPLTPLPAADNVAALPEGGTWRALDSGGGAVTAAVRGLTAVGTNVYVGTDAENVGSIPEADHVAKWDGSAWSALGSDGSGDGWFSPPTEIHALAGTGSNLFVAGAFVDANGDPRADNVAWFDGTTWRPVGSDGALNGPINGQGHALALVDRHLYLAGSFTSAGGDTKAWHVASFGLSQIIAFPTPTVTPGPSAVPTPTVTPGPSAVPTPTVTPAPKADTTAPKTLLRATRIDQAKRKATFRFGSGEKGSKFVCKLDRKKYKPCTSPTTYKKLKRGKHVFRVKARDRAGNVDRTPIVRRFKIKRR